MHPMLRAVQVCLAAVAALALGFSAAAQGGPDVGHEVAVEREAVAPGGTQRFAVQVTVSEGWHVNANKPLEDYLIPTELTLESVEGVTVSGMAYPEAELLSFAFSEEPLAVYENAFVIGVEVDVADNVQPGAIEIPAVLSYQGCNDTSCWAPQSQDVTLTLDIAEASTEPIEEHAGLFAPLEFAESGGDTGAAPKPVTTTVAPGGEVALAIRMRIPEKWHVNAHEPLEDFLIPTELIVEPPDGFTVAEIVYPEAENKTFDFSESPMAVYEGEIVIGARITVSADVAAGDYPVKTTLKYQACDDKQCFAPTSGSLELTIFVDPDSAAAPHHADVFQAIAFTGVKQQIETDAAPDATASAAPVDDDAWRELLPQFTVTGQAGGYLGTDDFLTWLDGVESGEQTQATGILDTLGSVFSGGFSFAGMGLPLVILLTLVGGVALNLTPCVLPVIPINLAIIGAGAQAGSRSRGFALGGVYGLGIALIYGVLGLVVVLGLGSFGTINASPWFNIGIAVLFIVLALAMFDVLLIDFSKYQTKLGIKKDKGSFLFAFIMGCVCALLAGACVAPVVIAVILYSQDLYAAGNIVGLFLPFLLGVGMALPWPVAGAGLSFLPKPGMWMVRVKQAFGVFILVFAAYYGYQGWLLLEQRYFVDRDAVVASAQEGDWEHSLSAGLARAQAEGKPVFIDFWATWCKSCMTMNKTTFKEEAVLDRLDGYVKIKYQAQTPDAEPHSEVLAYFDGYTGLPHYGVLQPK